MKVKKGQKVKVIAGKHRGSEGLVVKVYTKTDRVEVEGVNVKKKTLSKKNTESGSENFIFIQHPIHVSNVKVIDEKVQKIEAKSAKDTKDEKSVKGKKKIGKKKSEK